MIGLVTTKNVAGTRNAIAIAFLFGVLGASTGCATVLGPKTYDVAVSSTPEGARVLVDDVYQARTPCVVQVPRGGRASVDVTYGDQSKPCRIGREVKAGWLLADVLLGLLPLLVDAATGNWYGPDNSTCSVYFGDGGGGDRIPPNFKRRKRERREAVSSQSDEDLVRLCDAGVDRFCDALLDRRAAREAEKNQRRCEDTDDCTELGLCSLGEAPLECRAASDEDCARSTLCRDGGACTARDGACVRGPLRIGARRSATTTSSTAREVFSPSR